VELTLLPIIGLSRLAQAYTPEVPCRNWERVPALAIHKLKSALTTPTTCTAANSKHMPPLSPRVPGIVIQKESEQRDDCTSKAVRPEWVEYGIVRAEDLCCEAVNKCRGRSIWRVRACSRCWVKTRSLDLDKVHRSMSRYAGPQGTILHSVAVSVDQGVRVWHSTYFETPDIRQPWVSEALVRLHSPAKWRTFWGTDSTAINNRWLIAN
jgi:hypothetical protein